MFNFSLAEEPTAFESFISQYGMIILIVVMCVVLYFVMIRPQKKQEKETANMRNGLQVNDEIVTIGGIVGIITNVSGKDTITIVTSRDKTRIQILRTAVARVQVPAETGKADNGSEPALLDSNNNK